MRDFLKPVLIGSVFVALAALFSGAAEQETDAVLVEEIYTVKAGDTLWDIAETYLQKNTGTHRYILEYKSGIEELNPWLVERRGMIYPGDEIKVTYWVKEEQK